jgi:hypothetical protein
LPNLLLRMRPRVAGIGAERGDRPFRNLRDTHIAPESNDRYCYTRLNAGLCQQHAYDGGILN